MKDTLLQVGIVEASVSVSISRICILFYMHVSEYFLIGLSLVLCLCEMKIGLISVWAEGLVHNLIFCGRKLLTKCCLCRSLRWGWAFAVKEGPAENVQAPGKKRGWCLDLTCSGPGYIGDFKRTDNYPCARTSGLGSSKWLVLSTEHNWAVLNFFLWRVQSTGML